MYESFISPVFTNLQGREEYMGNLEKKFDTFTEWHGYIEQHHQTMVELAKWHVRNHWEEVDWKDFEVTINDKEYSNQLSNEDQWHNERMKKVAREWDAARVRFKEIKFVYDESDGDLSIDIDGKWKFMDDEEVVDAVLYIERKKK